MYRSNTAWARGRIEACKMRHDFYDELQKIGSFKQLLFRIAREYDPAVVASAQMTAIRPVQASGNISRETNPNFRPDSAEWRSRVQTKIESLLKRRP